MNPQSFSKRIGNKRLKIGISVNELVIISSIPAIGSFFKLHEGVSLSFMILVLGGCYLKNSIFEKGQVEGMVLKHDYFKMDEVKVAKRD